MTTAISTIDYTTDPTTIYYRLGRLRSIPQPYVNPSLLPGINLNRPVWPVQDLTTPPVVVDLTEDEDSKLVSPKPYQPRDWYPSLACQEESLDLETLSQEEDTVVPDTPEPAEENPLPIWEVPETQVWQENIYFPPGMFPYV